MSTPEQIPFVEAVASCLVTKYTFRGLHMVDSRVSNSCFGGCFISACVPKAAQGSATNADAVRPAWSTQGVPACTLGM